MLFGLFILSLGATADFFSSFFRDEVLANTKIEVLLNNSQNMALLQANTFSVLIFKDKTENSKAPENASVFNDNTNIMSNNALSPATGSLGATGGIEYAQGSSDDISIYVVRRGDSLSQIAEMFDVSVNTILWANDIKRGDKIGVGDIFFILPISGVKHIIEKGQTLNSIAKLYKVDILTITSFNGISKDTKIAIGDELIIPEAQMPNDDVPSKSPKSSPKQPVKYYATGTISDYFINPVPEYTRRSQGLHGPGNRGIDLAAPKGARILASADGRVLLSRMGYNGGYGNMVILQHPNGTKTLYAHMTKTAVRNGAQVAQGEVIGYIGSTGRSTGSHLHFEVFNTRNPGSNWTWAKN